MMDINKILGNKSSGRVNKILGKRKDITRKTTRKKLEWSDTCKYNRSPAGRGQTVKQLKELASTRNIYAEIIPEFNNGDNYDVRVHDGRKTELLACWVDVTNVSEAVRELKRQFGNIKIIYRDESYF